MIVCQTPCLEQVSASILSGLLARGQLWQQGWTHTRTYWWCIWDLITPTTAGGGWGHMWHILSAACTQMGSRPHLKTAHPCLWGKMNDEATIEHTSVHFDTKDHLTIFICWFEHRIIAPTEWTWLLPKSDRVQKTSHWARPAFCFLMSKPQTDTVWSQSTKFVSHNYCCYGYSLFPAVTRVVLKAWNEQERY